MAKLQVCAKCGADAPEGEFLQHFAECPLHPNKQAVARIEEIRNAGGNTKDFQTERVKLDTGQESTTISQPIKPAPTNLSDRDKTNTAPVLLGTAEFILSSDMMQTAMKLFLETYFNLHSVVVEKVTGNNAKGYRVKFRSE